jgi:predicted TIM-barrel fold metal-dependent hydrolase
MSAPPAGLTIDAHHHLWDPARGDYPWMTGRFAPLRRAYAAEDLIPELDAGRVRATVVVQARADLRETRDLLGLTARHGFLAGVVGWVDLASAGAARQLEAFRAGPQGRRLVGVRHDAVHRRGRPAVRPVAAHLRLGLARLPAGRELPAGTHRRQARTRLDGTPAAGPRLRAERRRCLPARHSPAGSGRSGRP